MNRITRLRWLSDIVRKPFSTSITKIDNMNTKIDTLFGSRTRILLLNKLVMNSDRSFYIRELSRDIKVTFSAVHKEIENLKRLNLITEETKGRLRLSRINKSHPIYNELRQILLKTESLGDLLRGNLEKIGSVKYALIYGSFAKGEETGISDMDLLIVGKVDEDILVKLIATLEGKIGREINYVLWSEEEFNRRVKEKNHFLMEVMRNPVITLIGDVDEFRKAVKR